MKIIRENQTHMTLVEFANKYNLTLRICERKAEYENTFYADFEGVERKGNSVLISTSGNGKTPYEAVDDYRQKISGTCLVLGAYSLSLREVCVPILTSVGECEL